MRTKKCKVCHECKDILAFRRVNKINMYTSKTCISCEDAIRKTELAPTKTSGYLYLVFDQAFPSWIKIGATTSTPETRLNKYNGNRPIRTVSFLYVSIYLKQIFKLEEIILFEISSEMLSPPGRKEWFHISEKDTLLRWIKRAEVEAIPAATECNNANETCSTLQS